MENYLIEAACSIFKPCLVSFYLGLLGLGIPLKTAEPFFWFGIGALQTVVLADLPLHVPFDHLKLFRFGSEEPWQVEEL